MMIVITHLVQVLAHKRGAVASFLHVCGHVLLLRALVPSGRGTVAGDAVVGDIQVVDVAPCAEGKPSVYGGYQEGGAGDN